MERWDTDTAGAADPGFAWLIMKAICLAESFWKSSVYAALTALAFAASYREKYALSCSIWRAVCLWSSRELQQHLICH